MENDTSKNRNQTTKNYFDRQKQKSGQGQQKGSQNQQREGNAFDVLKKMEFPEKEKNNGVVMIDINSIVAYRGKPLFKSYTNSEKFENLVRSISADGLTNAITVREITEEMANDPDEIGKYEICSGYHRWMACKQLKRTEIPAYVINGTDGKRIDDGTFTLKLIESNFATREDVLTIGEKIDCIIAAKQLLGSRQGFRSDLMPSAKETNVVNELIAKMFHIKRDKTVAALLHGRDIPDEVLDRIDAGNVTYAVAYNISQLTDDNLKKEIYDYIIKGGRMTKKTLNYLIAKDAEGEPVNNVNIDNYKQKAKEEAPRSLKIAKRPGLDDVSQMELMDAVAAAVDKLLKEKAENKSAGNDEEQVAVDEAM